MRSNTVVGDADVAACGPAPEVLPAASPASLDLRGKVCAACGRVLGLMLSGGRVMCVNQHVYVRFVDLRPFGRCRPWTSRPS